MNAHTRTVSNRVNPDKYARPGSTAQHRNRVADSVTGGTNGEMKHHAQPAPTGTASKRGNAVVERNYLRVTGASITAPTDYRTFKPYIYRGAEPWKPKPREDYCTKTGDPATNASYRLHYRHGEKPCNACRTVNALSSRRSAQKQRTGIICDAPKPCSAEGYTWHQHQGETPCPECTRYHQKENPQ